MSGALPDERPGPSFTMYNVQYIHISHAIPRHPFMQNAEFCNIYKFSSYLTGNTLLLRYKAQPVHSV
jgi:hypothetical protein